MAPQIEPDMFNKILIANRGEIACRVMRTARQMGFRAVAVFSEADAHSPHVALADEAVCIGPAAASASYLNVPALLQAAQRTGAQAIHPGYGFLSENAAFAQACADAGLVFIGPPPQAITAMGDKASAKRVMREAGVPTVPGYLGEQQDDASLIQEAERLGYPLLVKAVSGGGGRGMRLVHRAGDLTQAITSARREAQSAFGDGTLMLERLIEDGRHIEIQVFADAHGNAVYIGERDCTAQRRRQKVIEESPSPVVTPAMREAMGRDAVRAAQAIGYRGAGTIEYIVDQQGQHYFLEMNTRLQVEHPVTEMVSGLDLVEWQLRVAAGQPLPLQQADIHLSGHAIEARLYAEDPYQGFAPQTGTVQWWRPAAALFNGVRIDDGITEGGQVSPHYDPMVAKLIVHGRDRDEAIRKLMATIDDAPLLGLAHNGRFLRDLVDHPRFRAGSMTTTLIDQWQAEGEPLLQAPRPDEDSWMAAAALFAVQGAPHAPTGMALIADSVRSRELTLHSGGQSRTWRTQLMRDGSVSLTDAKAPTSAPRTLRLLPTNPITADEGTRSDPRGGPIRIAIDGLQRRLLAVWLPLANPASGAPRAQALHLVVQGATHIFEAASPWPQASNEQDPSRALSPVAGTVTQVLVKPGDVVTTGQPLLSVEAMKMEMWLDAQGPGVVQAVHAQIGAQVQAKALLIELAVTPQPATTKED
jgi:geranyl-CoA carboxylase alpha subunit